MKTRCYCRVFNIALIIFLARRHYPMLNMSRTEVKTSIAGATTADVEHGRARRAISPISLPIRYVEPAVVAIDCILIVSLSALTGFFYPLVFLHVVPQI